MEESEETSPEGALSKLTALIRVFTTVLISLGTKFSPSRSVEINPNFVQEVRGGREQPAGIFFVLTGLLLC